MLKHFVIICFSTCLLLTSCKCNSGSTGNDSTTTTTTTTTGSDGTAKDTMNTASTNTTSSVDSAGIANSAVANAGNNAANESDNTKGKSFYKNGKSHTRGTSGTPGFFPEGSDRLLSVRDVEYLSDWGMVVMTNEIYARHGMIFSDDMLGKHFQDQKWYHPSSHNVESKLTKIEKENLEFIRNYKTNPGKA